MTNVPLTVSSAANNREVQGDSQLAKEFLARLAHDLRGPLQAIMGFAELLSMEIKGPLNEEQKQFIDYIQRDSRHLLSLIKEIGDLGEITQGITELQSGG